MQRLAEARSAANPAARGSSVSATYIASHLTAMGFSALAEWIGPRYIAVFTRSCGRGSENAWAMQNMSFLSFVNGI